MNKFIRSFAVAGRGIAMAYRDQVNLKVQTGLGFVAVALGIFFELSTLEWCSLLLSAGLVLTLEIINTSIEKAVDLVTREFHPLAGQVKDIAAGAVLLSSVISLVVGTLVFTPHVMAWWQS
ncbi:MAG TPA: diacylglycerol kinase family protein [Cyclobacteriaceae bacterium]|nr:diacylglycerol kinase family protein [Cyclobacteriaceae bacterium]